MSPGEIGKELEQKFPGIVKVVQEAPDLVVETEKEKLVELLGFLKTAPGLAFDFILFITAVDRVDYLEVVYGLRSMQELHQIIVKVRVPADSPEVPSITALWPAADFDERETYDLFGVRFTGHPNLERILMPDDWEGHPLRKSYPVDKRPARVY